MRQYFSCHKYNIIITVRWWSCLISPHSRSSTCCLIITTKTNIKQYFSSVCEVLLMSFVYRYIAFTFTSPLTLNTFLIAINMK